MDGAPRVWYFTSAKDRCIKRKKRANISNTTITETLCAPGRRAAEAASLASTLAASAGGATAGSLAATTGPLSSTYGGHRSSTPSRGAGQRAAGGRSLNETDPGVTGRSSGSTFGSGGGAGTSTSTGAALGPWPHHGVVARFHGSITLPSAAAAGAAERQRSPPRGQKKNPVSCCQGLGLGQGGGGPQAAQGGMVAW